MDQIMNAEVVPSNEDLGHNPDASDAERLAMRAVDVQQYIKDRKVPLTPPVPAPVHITRDQVIQLAQTYGLSLLDPEGQSGVTLGRIAQLEQEAARLLTRAQVAEARVSEVLAAHEALKGEHAAVLADHQADVEALNAKISDVEAAAPVFVGLDEHNG